MTYKQTLSGALPEDIAREIDIFETQLELRKRDKIEEKLFAETRLRRGAYGQRYDNGQRHDGVESKTLRYPSGELTKGQVTLWDAPGMQRIKLPFGKVTADQLDVLAACAEEYSDGILHVTTRQDVQLHFVHIEDTPDMMRRLGAVGITTKEACGNSVRNVTACPYAGVCNDQAFDVAPYAHATTYFLMGHPDTQDFGRKFKIAFSGCDDHACGLVSFHDAGAVAKVRVEDGVRKRGFAFYIGGGLGSVPQAAKLYDEFLPEEELLPTLQAVCRVFTRLGERDNRARARFKFVLKRHGADEVIRLIREERKVLREDPRWTSYLARHDDFVETPTRPAALLAADDARRTPAFERWRKHNVRAQAQKGYVVATVACPLGDLTADQARALSDVAREFAADSMRTTVEQNLCFRWIPEADLPDVFERLEAVGLGEPGASTITDVTACPGTDTCKLGISSSRGLASELRRRLTVIQDELPEAVRGLHVKTSGCFNSCGQHHVADIGFLGVSRNVGGRRVPHFQLVVGGQWEKNGGAFGLAIGAVPSKNVPDLLRRLTERFAAERSEGEGFSAFIQRIGKKEVRKIVDAVSDVPAYEADRSFYSDWGDPREYSIGDMGVGECAGEVVPFVQMALAAAEREVFEAQVLVEEGKLREASVRALDAMTTAARGLTREVFPDLGDAPDEIAREFVARLVDTRVFHDPFAGPKFAHYYTRARTEGPLEGPRDAVLQRIEEAQLFVDSAYQCHERMTLAAQAASRALETSLPTAAQDKVTS